MQHIVHHSCPVCGSTRINQSLKCLDHLVSGMSFPVDKCQDCGLGFTQYIPSGDVMGNFYKSEDYVSHTDTRKGLVNQAYHQVRKFMLSRKQALVERYRRGLRGSLLDIGCGTGHFLYRMQEAGWQVSGTEPDPDARKLARQRTGASISEAAGLFTLPESSYDVITMWHVLEHVEDLHAYVEQIHRLLKPGGFFIAAVPNHQSFDAQIYKEYWAAYDVPRHRWHFSPRAIQKLGESHGFRMIGKQRMPFDSFYVSILSEQHRKRSFAFFLGALSGGLSLLQSTWNINRCSSLIYIFRKY